MPLTLAQYVAEAAQRDLRAARTETCEDCSVPLQEAIRGYRRVGQSAKCSDCYFDALSALIDEAPIGRPMSRVRAA